MPIDLNITLHASVPAYAFYTPSSSGTRFTINSLTLTEEVETIGDYAFYNLKLTDGNIKLPHSISQNNIGTKAFAYSNISSITIPESFTRINDSLFEHCSDLETVIFEYDTHSYEYNYVSNNVYREIKDNTPTGKFYHAGANLKFESADMTNEEIKDEKTVKFYIDNGDGTFFDAGRDGYLGTEDDMRFIPSYDTDNSISILAYVGNNGSWYLMNYTVLLTYTL